MSEAHDPRVFFAAERTLLAWVRTGLAVMGLGFVVARFGLFLRALRNAPDEGPHFGSTAIGLALVLLGSAAIAMAAWQHAKFTRRLNPAERPQHYAIAWPLWFAATLAVVGVALAAYLVMGVRPS